MISIIVICICQIIAILFFQGVSRINKHEDKIEAKRSENDES